MQLCVICNSNPETIWPKKWQCWVENGKFAASVVKLLGLPKYYEADLQKSAYCEKCQKKVYNTYLMVRKWDKLHEEITKLKQELEKNFHDALEKSNGHNNRSSRAAGDGGAGKENGRGSPKQSGAEEDKDLGNINKLRRKILKRLSRSHNSSEWDCNCCCDPTIPEAPVKAEKIYEKKKCCDDWEHEAAVSPSPPQHDQGDHDDDECNEESAASGESESEYSSNEENCNEEDCNLCRSSREKKQKVCFEKFCSDCALCTEEKRKLSKGESEGHGKRKKFRSILRSDSNSEDSEITTRTDNSKSLKSSKESEFEDTASTITTEGPPQRETSLSGENENSTKIICIPTDHCMTGEESTAANDESGPRFLPQPTSTAEVNSNSSTSTLLEPAKNENVPISSMLFAGGKMIADATSAKMKSLLEKNVPINYKEKRYRCTRSTCIKSFTTAEDLEIHVKRHHDGIKCPFICQECGKSFQRRRELSSHLLKHSGELPFVCHLCGRGFRTKPLLEMHLKTKHAEGERKFKCTFCDKSFITESKLKTHLTIHTKEYPFSCIVCGKGFSAKTFLNIHMTKHLESNPYKCTICSKTFSSPRNLQIHQYTHDKKHPYRCPECQAGMPSEATLKQHMLKHEIEKSHTCHVCNRKFQFPSSLKKHLKVHEGDKRFVCDFCNKSFIDKYKLTRHTRTHTGLKPYQCKLCQKSFATKDYLSTHLKKHNNSSKSGSKRIPESVPSVTFSSASDESVTSFVLLNNPSQGKSISPFDTLPQTDTMVTSPEETLSQSQNFSSNDSQASTELTIIPPQQTNVPPKLPSPTSYLPPPSAPPPPPSAVPSIMSLPEDDHPTQVEDLMATIQLENLSSEQLLLMDDVMTSSFDPQNPMGADDDDLTSFMNLTPSPLQLPSFTPPNSSSGNFDMLNSDFCELPFQ